MNTEQIVVVPGTPEPDSSFQDIVTSVSERSPCYLLLRLKSHVWRELEFPFAARERALVDLTNLEGELRKDKRWVWKTRPPGVPGLYWKKRNQR